MRSVLLLSGALSVLLTVSGCFMERPSDLTLPQIEDRMQSASDPRELSVKVGSYVQRQSLRLPGFFRDTVFNIELKYKKPDKLKIDTYLEKELRGSIIFNGGAAWVVRYPTREVEVLHGEAFDRMRALNHMSTPGLRYSRIFDRIEVVRAYREGREYYKLTCYSDLPDTEPFYVYVDPKDFRVKFIDAKFKLDGREIESSSKVVNYAMKEGVMVPEKVMETQNGITTENTVFDYRINIPIDDDEFLPPIFDRETRRQSENP